MRLYPKRKFKYLGVLLVSEETLEHKIGQIIAAAGVVLQFLYLTVVTKREPQGKALYLLISLESYLMYDHERWAMTEKTRLQI